jgi:hypothetical protein
MLHLFPQPTAGESPRTYPEAVSRLASVRHALRLVEPFGAGPASDIDDDQLASAFDAASPARQQLFDRRSASMIAAAASGLEALLDEQQEGREPNPAASAALAEQIRRELADVAGVVFA